MGGWKHLDEMKARLVIVLLSLNLLVSCAAQKERYKSLEPYFTAYRAYLPRQESVAGVLRVAKPFGWEALLQRPLDNALSKGALDQEQLGLFPGTAFRLTTGECDDCGIPKAVLWYFRGETIAVPAPGPLTSGIPQRQWTGSGEEEKRESPYPFLIWIEAPELIEHASLSNDAKTLQRGDQAIPLAVVPKIPANQAYVDHSTAAFFQKRPIRARGGTAYVNGIKTFIARTLWPEDSRIDLDALVLEPLRERETLSTLIMMQAGGTEGVFPARLLWERAPGQPRQWAGRPVLAFVLDGAQGDDDGAQAGHIALATGAFGTQGEWSGWLVNNFYPPEGRSEKGIISAMLPMDSYLMDLNSGEAYYRPNYMLVAVLRDDRVPRRIQAALQPVFYRYYCQQVQFDLATMNSTALLMDPLRDLGWEIPRMGVTSYLAAIAAFPVVAVIQRSLGAGIETFNLLRTERTRFIPREAFEGAGYDLLYLGAADQIGDVGHLAPFERMLANDLEAVLFVRIPQIPSSRAFGTYPVDSFLEYGARVLNDRSKWQTEEHPGQQRLPPELLQTCKQ